MSAPVTAGEWRHIREVFGEASELPPDRRDEFVATACASAPHLIDEVKRLLALNGSASDFLETPAFRLVPAVTHPILSTGETVADRFVIQRLVGRGGMGEVYEATDLELKELVALKVMRNDVDDPVRMTERFRREVQLARRVSHPSVCRVHDVGSHTFGDGTRRVVITMELLNGETLAQRLRRGHLPAATALSIARQLAEGLDAAHRCGILHRDIKPANVVLIERDDAPLRAVLTDFGIARRRSAVVGDVTRAGILVGTPEYLAPEQLGGQPGSVQSDIYALGIVTHEMLHGCRPFATSMAPDAAFRRALDPDPARRFSSAVEFVNQLSAMVDSRDRRAAWRSRLIRIAAAIVVVALLATAFRIMDKTADIQPASEVFMTEVINSTADPSFDGVSEILRSQLAQSPHFTLVPPDGVRETLAQMRRDPTVDVAPEVAREIAMRRGAPVVVFSTLSRVGSEFVLNTTIERVGPRPTLARRSWHAEFRATGSALVFDAVHRASVWIRTTAGESQEALAEQDRPPFETTTSSWEALRLFAKANAIHAAGKTADAVVLLEEALRVDPQFAAGFMRLGDLEMSLTRDAEGYAAWREAVRLLERQRLTSRESLRMRAQYLEDTGAFADAVKAYRAYVVTYPNDFHAAFYLGSSLANVGRTAEAVKWFVRSEQLRPGSVVALTHLARAQLDAGSRTDAGATIASLRNHGHVEWAVCLEALAKIADFDVVGALARIEPLRVSRDPEWVSRAATLRASWLTDAGRVDEARSELLAGISVDSAHGFRHREADKWIHLGALQCAGGDVARCVSSVAAAMKVSGNPKRAMLGATMMARAGRLRDAERLLRTFETAPDVPRIRALRHRLQAELATARGDKVAARRETDAAVALTPPMAGYGFAADALLAAGDSVAAEAALVADVDHPVRSYYGPEPEWPGPLGQSLARLEQLVNARGGDATRYERLLQRLRSGSLNPTSPR